jgi:hypothetical protein
VNASGVAQWAANGVALCTATGAQQFCVIASDGTGGAIVAWQDSRAGNDDIYAQRVNALGAVQWTTNGAALCTAALGQMAPEIVSDGAGGAIVAWTDGRSGNNDIYAQQVNVAGVVGWTADGVALCATTGNQHYSAIAADDAGGAIVAWTDGRGAADNIYAQRVNASGAAQWAANGIAVYATTDYQYNPEIVSNGGGGAIVAWEENRKGVLGVYVQRLNALGTRQWATGGVALGVGLMGTGSIALSPDGSNGAIAAWYDYPPGGFNDIFAQRVSALGALQWGATQVSVCAAVDDQRYASLASDGAGGAIVAWRDERNGTSDVYAQLVDRAGRTGWLAPDIAAVHDVPGDQGGQVFLSWDAARADRFMDAAMSHYSIWRSIDAGQAALAVEKGASEIGSLAEFDASAPLGGDPVIRVEEMGALTIYWQLAGTHDALYMEGYGSPVATLFDSSAACSDPHYFQVVAHTTNPQVFWKSDAASGWSVDNLAPCPPVGFAGERNVSPFGLELSWEPNAESDLSFYALYRGLSAGFVPGVGNLLGQLDETGYFDGEWNWGAGYFYKLSAIDINGNESPFALFSPDNLTGDETPTAPAASFLAQNFPNPFNPATRIAFGLAAPANVSLRIYDAAGRLVRTLVEDARTAGNYSELWDGRDSRGAAVSSGIYFYRFTAGTFSETRKMALLR